MTEDLPDRTKRWPVGRRTALAFGILFGRTTVQEVARHLDTPATSPDLEANPLTWLSPNTEVRPSPIHGTGLFARAPLAVGEVVAVKGGHVVDGAVWTELEQSLGSAEIQVAENLFIAPVTEHQRAGSMVFSNHSCDPNIAIRGQIVFVAMRAIAAGEELTHDWATTDDLEYTMECRCGSHLCRGTVTGQDWRLPELQERYRGWFCWHLERKIADVGDQDARSSV